MVLDYLTYLFTFLLGVCIGSFLNCVVYRLESKKSLAGRSFCPHCKHILSWKDLIPVLSFLFLKGKCRYCKEKISWQYPAVEVATGLIFFFIYDLKHYLIPDKVLFPAIFITLIFRLIFISGFLNYLLAVLIASGFFLAIFLVSGGKWMGFGDVKLAILMGLLLGFPNILVALFLAFFLGAIIGTAGMIFKRNILKI